VPERPPPPDQRPDYTKDVGAARPGEQRRPTKSRWHEVQSCVDYVILYLEQLRPPERPTADHYLRWARKHDGAPSPRLFDKHGGWAKVRALAQEQILRKQRATREKEGPRTVKGRRRVGEQKTAITRKQPRRKAAKKPSKRAPAAAKLAARHNS
jgi:hypothetical protein